MVKHLAIFSNKGSIEAVFSGDKKVEIRLSQDRIAPFNFVSHNDEVLIKLKGGMVYGQVEVENALYYENLTGEMLGKLRKEYESDSLTSNEFWQQHSNAKFISIIFIGNPKRYLSPFKFKKSDRRPWVVLDAD